MHTISAEPILRAYNGQYKYMTRNFDKSVSVHRIEPSYENGIWVSDEARLMLKQIAITEFQNKPAEECIYKAKPSEEDWVGCLCKFGDSSYLKTSIFGVLSRIEEEPGCAKQYYTTSGGFYYCCRPATRDEIKFFDDDTSEE